VSRFGWRDSRTLTVGSSLATVLRDKGDNAAAIRLRRQVLSHMESYYSPNHEEILTTAHNLGMPLYDDRQYAEAAKLFDQAYRGFDSQQKTAQALTSRSMLGLALLRLGKLADAEKHLLAVYNGLAPQRPLSDRDRNRLRWVTAGLAEVCEKTDKPMEAEAWRAEWAALPPEIAPPPHAKK
jgi:hypothetical protein